MAAEALRNWQLAGAAFDAKYPPLPTKWCTWECARNRQSAKRKHRMKERKALNGARRAVRRALCANAAYRAKVERRPQIVFADV